MAWPPFPKYLIVCSARAPGGWLDQDLPLAHVIDRLLIQLYALLTGAPGFSDPLDPFDPAGSRLRARNPQSIFEKERWLAN
jgi:hypothetical protein